ncbi:MAG: DUF4935 domain-containing protein [Desulfobulbaceae bacterium]|nr:DUF4935 domain-containing protein [Desulfobulbaceae bacterium]
MIVVLDTNVWLKERLLRSAKGVVLLYAIRHMKAKLLLPDTTRREILAGVERDGASAVNNVERGLRIIQSLVGTRPGIETPTAETFRHAVEARLDELHDLIQPVEVTSNHLERALDRVIEHRPPASKSEQFRDSILWECIRDLSEECLFVTGDTDFLDKSSKGTVLSSQLDEEAGGRVQHFGDIADLLRAVESQLPQINVERITNAIVAAVEPELESAAASQTWHPGDLIDSLVELYANERPNTITAVFELEFQALNGEDLHGTHIGEGVARVKGECLWSDDLGVSEIAMDRIELFTSAGDRIKGGMAFIRGAVFGGPPAVPYTVKTLIPRRPV